MTANYMLACLTSGSKFELGQTSGSHIGYSEVQEINCQDLSCNGSPNGKTISKYTSPSDYPDVNTSFQGFTKYANTVTTNPPCQLAWLEKYTTSISGNFFPYAPKVNFDWKRGLLKSQSVYDNQTRLRHVLDRSYNNLGDTRNEKIIYGLRIAHGPLWELSPEAQSNPSANYHNLGLPTDIETFYARYDIISAWNYTTQEKITEYDENGKSFVSTSDYFYDNPQHAQLTRVVKTTSESATTITEKTTYPADYQSSEADGAVVFMKGHHFMHGLPVEKTTLQQSASDQTVLSSEIIRYRTISGANGDTLLVKAEVAKLENARPLVYNPGNAANEFPRYLPVDGYQAAYWQNKLQRRASYSYDTYGNVIQARPEHGTSTCYLWGYNGTRLVAEIKNATYTQVKAALGITGSGPVSLGAGGLTTGQQATLRSNLPGAMVITWTHDPLVGVTSQTDQAGRTTSYEYDEFGRLLRVRDDLGHIVSQQRYHYVGQP